MSIQADRNTFIWGGNLQAWVSTDPAKVKALTDMPPPTTKRELQSFLGKVNYLSKFPTMTGEVCEQQRRLTSVNAA